MACMCQHGHHLAQALTMFSERRVLCCAALVGGTLFTIGAYLGIVEALNTDRVAYFGYHVRMPWHWKLPAVPPGLSVVLTAHPMSCTSYAEQAWLRLAAMAGASRD